jgi:carnitine-CoA ligase
VEGYGSTETNAVLGASPGEQRPGWMGPARPGFEAAVVLPDGSPAPPGVGGELVVRTSQPGAFAAGYFGRPEATASAWRNDWFHTGDWVVCSDDGWFKFLDRMTDSIRRRGENISSFDVEAAVASHPAVAQAAAYALPSSLGEDEVAVAVVRRPGHQVVQSEIVEWCAGRLAYFAVPRFVRFMTDLPMTENGKVRKQVLRQQGVSVCWDRERSATAVPTNSTEPGVGR